jgi:hypothetical protein
VVFLNLKMKIRTNGQAGTKKRVLLVTRQWRAEKLEGVIEYYGSLQLRSTRNTVVEDSEREWTSSHYHIKYSSRI